MECFSFEKRVSEEIRPNANTIVATTYSPLNLTGNTDNGSRRILAIKMSNPNKIAIANKDAILSEKFVRSTKRKTPCLIMNRNNCSVASKNKMPQIVFVLLPVIILDFVFLRNFYMRIKR